MNRIHFLHKNVEKLNSLRVTKVLKKKGISIFSPLDFQRIFGVSFFAAKNFINRNITTGLFIKIKNGLYVLAGDEPPKFVLANKIYQPSYISFETAMSYYHMIPESIYTVFSATTKSSREFEALDTTYLYHKVKKKLFFGYTTQKIDDVKFLIAEPEKAFIDFLYFVDLKKKNLTDRIDLTKIRKKDVFKVAQAFERESLMKLINKIYDQSKTYKRTY